MLKAYVSKMLIRLTRKSFELKSVQDTAAYARGMPPPTTQCPIPHCCPTLRQSFQHPQVQLSQYPLFNTRSSTYNPQANNTHYPTLQQSFQLIPTSCHHDHHNCHPFLSRVIMINDRRSRNRATLMYVPILKDLDKQMTCTCEWATIGQLVLMEMTWREEQSKAGGLDKLRHQEDEVIL